jgi:nucleolar complex protein 3
MSKLKEMRLMLDESDPLIALPMKKLAAISLLEVFKDIIPEYRIRQLTEQEKEVKVKKDVKRLRDFEGSLISNYKAYLAFLESAVKGII